MKASTTFLSLAAAGGLIALVRAAEASTPRTTPPPGAPPSPPPAPPEATTEAAPRATSPGPQATQGVVSPMRFEPPSTRVTGSAWLARMAGVREADREAEILAAAGRGEYPAFLRQLVPITVEAGGHRATYGVMPDVFAIGTDADFIRVPMKPATAQRLAAMLGMLLPTSKIVDDIDAHAVVRLTPHPVRTEMAARGLDMNSLQAWARSNEVIEAERGRRTGLITGGKKHIITHPRMGTVANRGRLWIYGWFYPTVEAARRSGTIPASDFARNPQRRNVQSVSTAHNTGYVDYSHGVQLVSDVMIVDGRQVRTADVLANASLAPLLSKEGRFTTQPAYPT